MATIEISGSARVEGPGQVPVEPVNSEDSGALKTAFTAGEIAVKQEIVELVQGWVSTGPYVPLTQPEEFHWFLRKRAHERIHSWLMKKGLAALTPCSPTGTGIIIIARGQIDHVVDSRTNKDCVSPTGVVELLGQLFAHGSPAYASHDNPKKYPNQLLMFDATYKAKDSAAKGESPCAALEFDGTGGFVNFRLNTAFWISPARLTRLKTTALK